MRRALEGPEAIEAVESWKKEAKVADYRDFKKMGLDHQFGGVKPMQLAHLRDRLRVILSQGCEEDGDWYLDASEDYAALKSQNIVPKPEVQATLWCLPGLSAADACHEDVLEGLVKTTNEEVFQTDTVQAVVQAAWAQMRFSTAWEVISCLLTVGLLCVASYTFRDKLPQATATRRSVSMVSFVSVLSLSWIRCFFGRVWSFMICVLDSMC